jgi:hypothetical protein
VGTEGQWDDILSGPGWSDQIQSHIEHISYRQKDDEAVELDGFYRPSRDQCSQPPKRTRIEIVGEWG